MEVLNYILPEHDSIALQSLPRVVNMLAIYSNLFGLYPFIKKNTAMRRLAAAARWNTKL
jgi:hypothetical protein